jgi:pyrroloquinoline quinone biosynthesis protein E
MKSFSRIWERIRPFRLDSLLFEVTPRCNLACAHCYNVWKDGVAYQENELSTEGAKLLIAAAIRQSRCRQFTFTGGEPCLREDLEELVAFAAPKCDNVALISNGTRLEAGRVRSLLQAGVGLFELPLNSAKQEMHDRLAGVPGSFDRVTRAAAEIRYQGGELLFVFVGTKHNIDHWRETLKLGIALGARGFLFNRYNAGGSCHENPEDLMPSLEQVRRGLEIAEECAAQCGIGIGAGIAIPACLIDPTPYPHVSFGFCSAGTRRAYITLDSSGNVRPCNHTSTILGNLFETPMKRLVHGEEMRAFIAAHPAFCTGCGLESICLGGCKAAAEACCGSLSACEPFLEMNRDRARPLISSPNR